MSKAKKKKNIARADDQAPTEIGVYSNRTLNLRSIAAIGYDMDYTLIHYRVDVWERHAFDYAKVRLLSQGWPVSDLQFDPEQFIRGLVLDVELGNIIKANRFGYIKRAWHGTKPLPHDKLREVYARTFVDLADPRYCLLTTLFSLSEASLYAHCVDLLDQRALPEVLGYTDLYERVKAVLDDTHMEGELKKAIISNSSQFVERDPDVPLVLLDQKCAGKRLLLITNSDWRYTRAMMSYTFDQFLPGEMQWHDLFDLIVVSARKPFFFDGNQPLYEVVVEQEDILRPLVKGPVNSKFCWGGNAALVENYLGLSGDEILYVGDHVLADVHVSKSLLRWRTALVLRELEAELQSVVDFAAEQQLLSALMAEKTRLELATWELKTAELRKTTHHGPQSRHSMREIKRRLLSLREKLEKLDARIGPLAEAAGTLGNAYWGPLMRTGADKSFLARQVEQYADIYLSRVGNFLQVSPFAFLRSNRGTLPHDPDMRYSAEGG